MTTKESGTTRQQQIITATLNIIAKRGLAKLTTAAIAQEVGFSEGSIFKHFPGKEAILKATIESIGNLLVSQSAAIASLKDTSPKEKLRLILDLHLSLAKNNPAMPRLIFSDELYTSYASLKETIRETIADYTQNLEVIFKEGVKTGEFKSSLPAHTLAFILIGLIQSTVIRWRLDDGIDPQKQGQPIYQAIISMISPG